MTFPSEANFFSIAEFSDTLRGSITKHFGTVRPKVSDGISYSSLPPTLPPPRHLTINISVPKFSQTVEGSLTNFFGSERLKFFDGETWYSLPPPFYLWIFSSPEVLWTTPQKLFQNENFRYCETKQCRWKIVTNPVEQKNFQYLKVVTPWRVPLLNISALWNNIFSI